MARQGNHRAQEVVRYKPPGEEHNHFTGLKVIYMRELFDKEELLITEDGEPMCAQKIIMKGAK